MTECKSTWGKKWLKLDCHTKAIQDAATAAEKFCGRWFRFNPNPGLMILCGEPNSAKTHIARKVGFWANFAAMRAYEDGKGKTWKRFPSVVYLRWPEVVDAFRENMNGSVDDMLNAGLLILDDVGAEYDPTQNATNKLCQVLSRREREFTIITTNIAPASWPDKFDSRICDRFFRNSEVIDLFGVESYAAKQLETRVYKKPYND